MPKRGRVYINRSISFPPDLLAAARKRARNLGLPFSAYVQKCLERDLAERGAIILTEREEGAALIAAEPHEPLAESPKPKRGRTVDR